MAVPDPRPPRAPVVVDCRALAADLEAIERLARLVVAVRRDGRTIRLWAATPELRALLGLCGLADVMPAAGARVEAGPDLPPEA